MTKRRAHKATKKGATKKPIKFYDHQDKKRANNPPVGLVTPQTDPERGAKKTYQYDPHLDPQLVWAGKPSGSCGVARVAIDLANATMEESFKCQ